MITTILVALMLQFLPLQTGTITGNVYANDVCGEFTNPVEGYEVYLYTNETQFIEAALTDSNGNFTFDNLQLNTPYEVEFMFLDGGSDDRFRIDVLLTESTPTMNLKVNVLHCTVTFTDFLYLPIIENN